VCGEKRDRQIDRRKERQEEKHHLPFICVWRKKWPPQKIKIWKERKQKNFFSIISTFKVEM
jgi:hypothetical protein